MSEFHVVAIPETTADRVRETLRSPQYGHPAHIEPALGYGPCRLCLRTFDRSVDQRLLFTYNPFQEPDALPAPGPVYIHAIACPRYDGAEFPPSLRQLPLLFEAYEPDGTIGERRRVDDASIEHAIGEMLARPATSFINVRNAEAGCFIARIERRSNGD